MTLLVFLPRAPLALLPASFPFLVLYPLFLSRQPLALLPTSFPFCIQHTLGLCSGLFFCHFCLHSFTLFSAIFIFCIHYPVGLGLQTLREFGLFGVTFIAHRAWQNSKHPVARWNCIVVGAEGTKLHLIVCVVGYNPIPRRGPTFITIANKKVERYIFILCKQQFSFGELQRLEDRF